MSCEPMVRVQGLSKRYRGVQALDNVALEIGEGAAVALVGPSGSGKSTLARCLAGIERPDAGEIRIGGEVQLVFQDAAGTLNPRFPAGEIVAEPLRIRRTGSERERHRRALELMEQVGLPAEWAVRQPGELSGGQRQRLAIARALAPQPRFLILDEALSGLDLSIQAQILNLLYDLQQRHGLTSLHITHDTEAAASIADQVLTLRGGRLAEA
jgi:ABC-type dipeptide/oligopeptide/nickel transport system ATPase subunit